MDQYFTLMTKIVNQKKTSSRVRLMLQDVIDLRKVSHISFEPFHEKPGLGGF